MCDCYGHKCECCDELIPMHIADFGFPRDDFRIWCEKHINKAPAGAIIFETLEPEGDFCGVPAGWKCAILGPDVGLDWQRSQGNHPNIGSEMKCKEVQAREDGQQNLF